MSHDAISIAIVEVVHGVRVMVVRSIPFCRETDVGTGGHKLTVAGCGSYSSQATRKDV
jgi:hypothetical protein